MSEQQQTRREFIKKATYVAPVIFTLSVTPAIASTASPASGTAKSSGTSAGFQGGLGPGQEYIQKVDKKRKDSKLKRQYQLSQKK